jgi:hypothetical protein
VNVGVAAHITAASSSGPRYDASLTSDERRAAVNGIWLCQTHGKLVDNDADAFPVELLRQWKEQAEREAFRAVLGVQGARPRGDTPWLVAIEFSGQAIVDQILRQSAPVGLSARKDASVILMHSDLSGFDVDGSRIVLNNGIRLIPPHDAVLRAAEVLAGLSGAYTAERWVFDKDRLPYERLSVQLLDGDVGRLPLEVVEQLFVTCAVDPDLVPDDQVAPYLTRLTQFSDPLPRNTHSDLWWEPTSVGRRLLRRLRELGELATLMPLLHVAERLEPKPGYSGTHDYRQFLLARAAAVDLDVADWERHGALLGLLLSDRSPLNDYWQAILRSGRPRERPLPHFS